MYLFDGCRGVSVFLADLVLTIEVHAPLSDGVGMMLVRGSRRCIIVGRRLGVVSLQLERLSAPPTSLLFVPVALRLGIGS